jgi:hypothetical protein
VAKASKVTTANVVADGAAVAVAITVAAVAISAVVPAMITAAAPAAVPARKGVDFVPPAPSARIFKASVSRRTPFFCW